MKEKDVLILGGLFLAGLLLLNNPRCTRGCRTVAEHLTSHALDDLIAGLLA
jgi:hypothetical protein